MSALLQRVPPAAIRLGLLVIAALLALVAFETIGRIAQELRPSELRAALATIKGWRIALAFGLTCTSYAALSCYDGLALRLMGRRLPWKLTARAAFTSYAISNNLGFSLLSGGSTRYAHYARLGLSSGDVARLTMTCALIFWSALLLMSGVALVSAPAGQPLSLSRFDVSARLLGAVFLFTCGAGWAVFLGSRKLRHRLVGNAALELRSLATLQAVALVDVLSAAGALFVLVGGGFGDLPRLTFAYATALIVGIVSHVPGGLGVFEATFLGLAAANAAAGLAAILLYRLIYYFLPLLAALALQAARAGPSLMKPMRNGVAALARLNEAVTPTAAAMLATAAGAILLLSSSTPALPHRIHFLEHVLPWSLIQASHLLASLAGTALLMLAPALRARLRSALVVSVILLVTGALFCVGKGVDYEEAVGLILIAAVLQASSSGFYRTAGLGSVPLSAISWATILCIFAIAFIAFAVSHDRWIASHPWWTIEFGSRIPHSARSLIGAAVLLAVIGFRQLLSAPLRATAGPAPSRELVAPALACAKRTDAFLALTGDKQFLSSSAHDAFVMFRVQHRTWVSMGDPVGPKERWPELAWSLREAADRNAGRVCFYEVSERMLPVLVDLGLLTMKSGEEAIIDLVPGLTLPKGVRGSIRRASKAGLEFEVIPAAEVPLLMPQLKEVSDNWLRGKSGEEKCFSLGRFDPEYLQQFDCAVIRQGNRICAFANLWELPNKAEASIDLMRQCRDAPHGTMDLLIGNCIQRAAALGYSRFSLGIAPLSGLAARPLAPLWARVGATVYRRGKRLYGFEGLRAYKDKFHPRWEGRYVGTMHGLNGWLALLDTARLIAN